MNRCSRSVISLGLSTTFTWCIFFTLSSALQAGVTTAAIRETVEYLSKKFGKDAAAEGIEKLTVKLETLSARYGDDALKAARKVGPQAIKYADDAGEYGGKSLYLMSKYGDDALRVVRDPAAMKLVSRYGDDAAEAMMKHGPEMTGKVIATYGDDGAKALGKLSRGGAIELATLQADDMLAKVAQPKKLLDVIARYGDPALDFTRKHWQVLLGAAAFTAFVNDPQPYLDGVKQLADVTAANTIKPLMEGVAGKTDWTLILGLIVAGVVTLFALRTWLARNRLSRA